MRRFEKSDYYGYDASPLPSGEPMFGQVRLPDDGPTVDIVVSGDARRPGSACVDLCHCDVDSVVIQGELRDPGWSISWEFPSERDAVAFATMIESGQIGLPGLESLAGGRLLS